MVFKFTLEWFLLYSALCVLVGVGFTMTIMGRKLERKTGKYCPHCACKLPFHGLSCQGGKTVSN